MSLSSKILVPALLSCLFYSAAPAAQGQKSLSLPQAERLAVDLKQGMSLEEVQKLLGKPKRTSLKADPFAAGGQPPVGGVLRWTYSWSSSSQADRTLQVVFASKSAELWQVNSWDWNTY